MVTPFRTRTPPFLKMGNWFERGPPKVTVWPFALIIVFVWKIRLRLNAARLAVQSASKTIYPPFVSSPKKLGVWRQDVIDVVTGTTYSYAPILQEAVRVPGREMPRWSLATVAAQPLVPAGIAPAAELLLANATVRVAPPLFANPPEKFTSWLSLSEWLALLNRHVPSS